MPFLPSTTDRVDRGFAAGRSPGACAFEIVIIAIDAAMMLAARAALITPSDSVVYNSLARGGISICVAVRFRERSTDGVRNRPFDRSPAHFYTEDTYVTRAPLVNLCLALRV